MRSTLGLRARTRRLVLCAAATVSAALVLVGVGVTVPQTAQAAGALTWVGRTDMSSEGIQLASSADGSVVSTITQVGLYVIDTAATVADPFDRRTYSYVDYWGKQPEAVAVSPNGQATYVYTLLDAKLHVVSTSTGTEVATLTLPATETFGMAVSADNTKLYVARWGNATIQIYNLDPSDLTVAPVLAQTLTGIKRPGMVTVGPNGKVYVPVSGDGTDPAFDNKIAVIDPSSGNSVSYISGVGTVNGYRMGPRGIVFSPVDSTLAYVYNNEGNEYTPSTSASVSTIRVTDNTVTNNVFVLNGVYVPNRVGTEIAKQISISSDGSLLYVGANDGIHVLDVAASTNTRFNYAENPSARPYDMLSLPSDDLYVVGTAYNQVTGAWVYRYAGPPTVTQIGPTSGTTEGGTSVTIAGTGFVAGATVKIGYSTCTNVVVVSPTSITCTTPAGYAGAADVVVTNPDRQAGTLQGGYTYVTPGPTITRISPSSGTTAGGTLVTISGTGYTNGATVTIGGQPCTIVQLYSDQITCRTPAGTAGATDVVVTNPDSQTATLTDGYTYVAPAGPPSVTSIGPDSGSTSGGQSVTIDGSGFVDGATVTIGGQACAPVVFVSSSQLTCTTPPGTAGAKDVVVTNPNSQAATLTGGYGPTGVHLAHLLSVSRPDIAVLFLTRHPDAESASSEGLELPPNVGFLRKHMVSDTAYLLDAIEKVFAERAEEVRQLGCPGQGIDGLSAQQMRVLRLLAEGHNNTEIARRSGMSVKSVERWIDAIYRELELERAEGLNRRVEAARRYYLGVGIPQAADV